MRGVILRKWCSPDGKVREAWLLKFVVRGPDGRTVRIRKHAEVNDRKGAERERERIVASILAGTYGKRLGVPTLKELVTEFYESPAFLNRKLSTRNCYKDRIDRLLLPALGAVLVNEIASTNLDKFAANLANGRRVETQRGILRVLKLVLRFGKERGALESVPWIEMPEEHAARKEPRYLTPDEGDVLIAATNADERALIVVGLRTGIRVGELLGLEFEDVDYKRKRIQVVRSVVEGETQTPKSGRARYVPLSPQALAALKEQRFRHPDAAGVSRAGDALSGQRAAQTGVRAGRHQAAWASCHATWVWFSGCRLWGASPGPAGVDGP